MSDSYDIEGRGMAGLTLTRAAGLLDKRELTSVRLTGQALERAKLNESNAYIHINENALKAAAESDARRAAGKALSLIDGAPVALSDNICVEGMPMTCASKTLETFVPPYTATVAERLFAAGAVLTGKLNIDEFAASDTGLTSVYGPIRNPHDNTRSAGGSSGGAAAAVAEGSALFALGIDTGGGIRQPAALCGVVGFKPTYGLVSRYGMTAYASSMDQPGIACATAEDCALVLSLIAGRDSRDACSLPAPAPVYTAGMAGVAGEAGANDLKGVRIGVPIEYLKPMADEELARGARDAINRLREAGAVVEECSLPYSVYARGAYNIISAVEFNSNMNRYDGVKFGFRAKNYDGYEDMLVKTRSQAFGREVKQRIMFGVYSVTGGRFETVYLKAAKIRTLIIEDFRNAFGKHDLLLTPAVVGRAPLIGPDNADTTGGFDANYCFAASGLAGLPAISLPWAKDKEGMPVGIQLIGPALSESLILRVARGLELAREQ